METPETRAQPLAVLGARGCDLQALRILDRVFLGIATSTGRTRPGARTCSWWRELSPRGPHVLLPFDEVRPGGDLRLRSGPDGIAGLLRGRSRYRRGGTVITASNWSPCAMGQIEKARELPEQLRCCMAERASQPRQDADAPSPRGATWTPPRSTTCCSRTWNTRAGTRWPSVAWPAPTVRWSARPASAARWKTSRT